MAGSFVFVQYTGDDAGEVLFKVLSGETGGDDESEGVPEPKPKRIIGFQIEELESHTELAPKPEDELEDDGEDEDDDGEHLGE